MLALLVTNIGNTVAEFAGRCLQPRGVRRRRYVSVPLDAAFVWWMVVFGSYRSVEKVFLVACLFYLAYPISGLLARPDWEAALEGTLVPRMPLDCAGVSMVVGIVGTTIAPWMQFYLQSSVVEKESKARLRSGAARRDPRLDHGGRGGLLHHGRLRRDAAPRRHPRDRLGRRRRARPRPLAGRYASWLFAVGLANASLFAASILPLATAYSVCEGLGLEAGVDRSFGEAPSSTGSTRC